MEKKNNLDPQYNKLLEDILENGTRKQTRNGEVLSVFGRQIRHDMADGFPLLTGKKMFWKGIVTELLWFLRGDTNIKYLVDNNCHIWDGDAYKAYENWYDTEVVNLPFDKPKRFTQEEFIKAISIDDDFAKRWGELGPIYGKQWRKWKIDERRLKWSQLNEEQKSSISKEALENTHYDAPIFTKEIVIDQIQNLIQDLKTNPDSRRLMVNAWNVGELDQMVLPPCHYGFQVYTRELSGRERMKLYQTGNYTNGSVKLGGPQWEHKWMDTFAPNVPKRAISLMWNQRSVDTFLGLPFNIASYGLLLEIIAKEVNMIPDELIGNLGDTHLYLNHVEQAKEQIGRELSLEERIEWLNINVMNKDGLFITKLPYKHLMDLFSKHNVPTRTREPYPLPTLILDDWYSTQGDPSNTSQDISEFLKDINVAHIRIEKYQSHPSIKAPLSN
jgi:thymidylate synthase